MIEPISSISLPSVTNVVGSFSSSRTSIQDSIHSLASLPNLNTLFFKKKPYLVGFCLAALVLFLRPLFKPLLKWQNRTQPQLKQPLPLKTPQSEISNPTPESSFLLGLKQQPKENIIPFFAQKLLNHRYNAPMKKQVIKEFFTYLRQLDDKEAYYSYLKQLLLVVRQASDNDRVLCERIQKIIDDFETLERKNIK